jgi:hypothetical protein
VGNIVNGVSFDILGYAPLTTQGQYSVHYLAA